MTATKYIYESWCYAARFPARRREEERRSRAVHWQLRRRHSTADFNAEEQTRLAKLTAALAATEQDPESGVEWWL
jgi:hypothetical protein